MVSVESQISESRSRLSGTGRQAFLNFLTVLIVLAFVIAAFNQTVFFGKPISRVYQLGQRDSLFKKYYVEKREGYDASVYQYFVPSHFYQIEQLRKGVLPLWNPLVGCGAPFLADIETAVFNPARLLLLFLEPMRSWNLLIVFNLVNLAVGTALLAISLGLRRFAAIFAALLCAFCPFLIFQSELIGSSASWIPLVLFAFLEAHKKQTPLSKAMAGFACSVMILSGHPEPSFFGIMFASLLYLVLALTKSRAALPERLKHLGKSIADIFLIGIFAFCGSAFMLLPFFELLANSDCYKLGLSGHGFAVPFNSIVVNLLHPAYKNSSPFLGILALPLFAYACIKARLNQQMQALLVCVFLALIIMCRVWPLNLLMDLPSFSWFVCKYCWPVLLVMLSVSAGFGFQSLVDDLQKNWRQSSISVLCISLLLLAGLCAIRFCPGLLDCARQDEAFEKMQVFNSYWTRDLIILTVFAIICVGGRLVGRFQAHLTVLAVVICSILSLAPIVKSASPTTTEFHYDQVEPIPLLLKDAEKRMLTMGRHVFCPSSNFCYGLNNLVPVNVYHPKRFQSFLIECGVSPEGVNQFFDSRLSSLTALAAVERVVSPQPVLGLGEKIPEPQLFKGQKKVRFKGRGLIELKGGALACMSSNRELRGSLQLLADVDAASELAVQAVLLDEKGNVLWLGGTEKLLNLLHDKRPAGKNAVFEKELLLPLPQIAKARLAVQLFDWKEMRYLELEHRQNSTAPPPASESPCQLVLAELDIQRGKIEINSELISDCRSLDTQSRFKLLDESASGVRVYQDSKALPQAYLSQAYFLCSGAEESLKLSKELGGNNAAVALLEAADSDKKSALQNFLGKPLRGQKLPGSNEAGESRAAQEDGACRITKPDCNHVLIKVSAPAKSVLIISQNFYPGWKARLVQGEKLSDLHIYRANYLFQAVLVPEGESVVELEFMPSTFIAGLLFLGAGAFAAVFLRLRSSAKAKSGS